MADGSRAPPPAAPDGPWFPPSRAVPLPVELITGAAPWPAPQDHGWFPPSREHPLPVEIIGSGGGGGGYLPLEGGTLTGPLYLVGDPVTALEAASKGYVDAAVGSGGAPPI